MTLYCCGDSITTVLIKIVQLICYRKQEDEGYKMLETRNLCKVYKPKKGVPVKALDNVSLKFPEKVP